MIKQEEVYRIGRIGKTHGVKGELSFLFDDDVFDRVDCDYLVLDVDGILVPFFIEEYRFKSDSNAIVKFCDVDTQPRAAELTGCDVYFPRALADEDDEPSLSIRKERWCRRGSISARSICGKVSAPKGSVWASYRPSLTTSPSGVRSSQITVSSTVSKVSLQTHSFAENSTSSGSLMQVLPIDGRLISSQERSTGAKKRFAL